MSVAKHCVYEEDFLHKALAFAQKIYHKANSTRKALVRAWRFFNPNEERVNKEWQD